MIVDSFTPALQKILGLKVRDEVDNEKIYIFTGIQDAHDFHIALYPRADIRRSIVAIVAYERGEHEICPIEDFETWVLGKFSPLAEYMKRKGIELRKPSESLAPPESLTKKILTPHKGLIMRLGEAWSATYRRLLIVIVSIPALYLLMSEGGVDLGGYWPFSWRLSDGNL